MIYLGSDYGGWNIDIDYIKDGDTIISGGIGNDMTFDLELLKLRDIKIIAIDPTYTAHKLLEDTNHPNITIVKKAISTPNVKFLEMYESILYKNEISESSYANHGYVSTKSYLVETISITELIKTYKPSLIKLDIEGSEMDCYKELLGIKQICIEFHHHCISTISLEEVKEVVNFFINHGYKIIDNRNYHEITFLL